MDNPAAEVTRDRPEIVIGLVGAVGTDLRLTSDLIIEILRTFGYFVVEPISLSKLLDHVEWEEPLPEEGDSHYEDYVDRRMTAGDLLRARLRRGGALAQMAVHEIVLRRAGVLEQAADPAQQPGNLVYLLRSLKHPKEVEALRKIYGARFVLVGAHSPRDLRAEQLAAAIAKSHASTDRAKYNPDAEYLAHRDEEEEDDDYGQHVGDTFPLADFFVDVSRRNAAREALERFIYAFFSYPYASPTRREYAMFHARAAAARSADLSRQVGAAIAIGDGDIVAVGCNEVPRFGGGSYWIGDPDDARDFQRGEDSNARMRGVIVREIQKILEQEWIAEPHKGASLAEFREVLGAARVRELTEFNRAVHAEMAALLDAARRGVSLKDAELFCTTFPCHNCAKHIVAAGIKRVFYIEPYAKSLAEDLHPDSIAIDHGHEVQGKVSFDPFVGVAPDLYLPLFTKGSVRRKDKATGRTVNFNPLVATPKLVSRGDFAYLQGERLALRELHDAIVESAERAAEQEGQVALALKPERLESLIALQAQDPEEVVEKPIGGEEPAARKADENAPPENDQT